MPLPTTGKHFSFFGGAVDDSPVEVDSANSAAIENFYRRRYRLFSRGGMAYVGDLGGTGVDGLGWARIGTIPYLLSAVQGDVVDFFTAATLSGGTARLTAGHDMNLAWVDSRVFMGTGYDANVRFDGNNVARALPAAPPSGGQATASSSGIALTGTFSYRFSFVSADGKYSYPSPATSAVTVTAQDIQILGIPQPPAGQDITAIALFRTQYTGGSDVFLLATLPSGTTDYVDGIADASLGIKLNNGNGAFNEGMPPIRYMAEHQNRLIGAGCYTNEGDTRTIFVSNVREPWYCPILPDLDDPNQGGRFPLQDIGAAGINGVCAHGNDVAIFTGGAGYFLRGYDNTSYTLGKFTEHGAVAHRAILSIKTLLIWASADGVYAWDGAQVQRISNDLYNTYIAETAANLAEASAYYYDGKVFFSFPDRVLYYDLDYAQWGTTTNQLWRVTTSSVYTSDRKPRVYAAEVGRARVSQLEVGLTDHGSAIPLRWKSGVSALGSDLGTRQQTMSAGTLEIHEKRIIYVSAVFPLSQGTAQINLYRAAGELIETWNWDLSLPNHFAGQPGSTYAAGTVISRFIERAGETARDEFFQLEVVINATAAQQIFDAGLDYVLSR